MDEMSFDTELTMFKLIARHVGDALANIAQEIDAIEKRRRNSQRTVVDDRPPQIDPSLVTLSIQDLPDLMTVKEAAEDARVARRSIYAIMERGELNYIKIGRLRRIPKTALAQIIDPNLKGGWKLGTRRT